jgi:hypothetical protein
MPTVTLFRDVKGSRLTTRDVKDHADLARLIEGAEPAPGKTDRSLLKLGTFGDQRSDGGGLRNDANMVSITGIEGDHDTGEMSPDEAAELLESAGIAALIQTTASHTDDEPHWHVFAFLSKPLTGDPAELKDARADLVGRLNSVLNGALKSESFTLSQSFFFGPVESQPAPTLIRVKGKRIDTLGDLPDPLPPVKSIADIDDGKDESRSADLMSKIADAVRAGKSDAEIHKEFDTHEHAADQPNPVRAVDRCIQKVREGDANLVEEINAKHSFGFISGKAVVMWNGVFDDNGGVPRISSVADMKIQWKNRQDGKTNPIDIWTSSPNRNEFGRIVFHPGVEDVGTDYNLWRGWGVEPKKGKCGRFVDHLREVICNGDEDLFDYLLQWLANSVQSPADKPGTAITMTSDQGAGKGQVGQYLAPIYGPHFAQLASSSNLLGQFNDWMAGKLLIFGDEVTWPGDRRGVDKLKALITEPTLMVERKHVPAIVIDSYARLMLASNRAYSAPAEESDRRFVVCKLSPHRIGDRPYWNALVAERNGGGPAAFLYDLLDLDITRDLRTTPKTNALAEQKLLHLDNTGRFWREMLEQKEHLHPDGHIFRFGAPVSTLVLKHFYDDFARRNRISFLVSIDELATNLRRYVDLERRWVRSSERTALGLGKERIRVYDIPSLMEARKRFEEKLGSTGLWSDPDDYSDLLK